VVASLDLLKHMSYKANTLTMRAAKSLVLVTCARQNRTAVPLVTLDTHRLHSIRARLMNYAS